MIEDDTGEINVKDATAYDQTVVSSDFDAIGELLTKVAAHFCRLDQFLGSSGSSLPHITRNGSCSGSSLEP